MIASIDNRDDKKIALKLHRQFAHPTSNKLKLIIQKAGINNKNLEKEIDMISEKCLTCLKFQKRPARPVVCVEWATEFNEMIAIDLKFWGKNYFLVMVDLATRFCSACVIYNKLPVTIVKSLFLSWIVIFGPPLKLISDNGGEFVNAEMRALGEAFSIKMMTTAAESPWSNGTCERLNGVLGKLVLKILDDVKCDVATALAWAVSARNSYYNYGGFSPNQLVFGKNPNMPDIFNSKLPGLSSVSPIEIVRRNLEAKKKAREEFVKFSHCEKVKRAIANNVREACIDKINIGDEVFYKRNESDEWHGPAKVMLIENKIATVRHGGQTLRVHGISLVKAPLETPSETNIVARQLNEESETNKNNEINDTIARQCDNKVVARQHEAARQLNENMIARQSNTVTMQHNMVSDAPLEENEVVSKGHVAQSRGDCTEEKVSKKRKMTHGKGPPSKKMNRVTNTVGVWKTGQRFQGIIESTGEYISGKIISRAGKAGKSNMDTYNIERDQDGYIGWYDLSEIKDLSLVNDKTEMIVFLTNNDVTVAKDREFQSWVENDVFEMVEDRGQKCISVRWVITEKVVEGKVVTKARLVVRGFEENTSDLQKDSPTCSREAIRILIAIAASKQWDCHTVDVKSAYLQGDQIKRTIFVRPPKEYDNGLIWKLKKTVYGLCDAARAWYMTIKRELISMSVEVCPLDNSLFIWKENGILQGVICIYVDDFLWSGTNLFYKKIIKRLQEKFLIGSSASITFTYVGLSIKAYKDGLTIDQDQYIYSLKPIPINKSRIAEKNDHEKNKLNEFEKKLYRALVGQITWVATHTRPDVAFEACVLSSSYFEATVDDLLRLNKLVEKLKRENMNLFFPRLENLQNCTLECFTDASFKNLSNGNSQGGLIIFLKDTKGSRCPIFWRSRKLGRVVKSALSAETQALVDGAEYGAYLADILKMVLGKINIKVKCYMDSKSLVDSLGSLKQMEPTMKQDTLVVRDMLARETIESVTWVRSKEQLADVLTKRGVCPNRLMQILSRD